MSFLSAVSSGVDASGGTTVTTFTDSGGTQYRIHAFENVGNDTFTVNSAPSDATVDVLVVGGGGAGGGKIGGGGGAGGVVFQQGVQPAEQNFNITIGGGGDDSGSVGDNVTFNNSNLGSPSSALGIVALGGGTGGMHDSVDARDGGSGGGAYGYQTDLGGVGLQPTSADGGFGNDGGDNTQGQYAGGGGGGAGGPGDDGMTEGFERGGAGGIGVDYSSEFTTAFGENGYFGGGGGGCSWDNASLPVSQGGLGGGGNGAGDARAGFPSRGEDALPNTGGGGGAGGYDGNDWDGPGAGGSGIVLIRYEI